MLQKHLRSFCALLILMMMASPLFAGGVAPEDVPAPVPVAQDKVTATPTQTSAAIKKARQAIAAPEKEASAVEALQVPAMRAKAAASVSGESWQISSSEGSCTSLSSIGQKVKGLGKIESPQDFAYQMQQRGYQSFVLDIGDRRDQMVRVKVPDMHLELLFVRPQLCR